ncbi:MAG TPA: hypothetical protein VHR36_06955 [Pyrinomonadaceae bacterium]|nr:hypothetical protein [Pyrinomonadaceae bacterium]
MAPPLLNLAAVVFDAFRRRVERERERALRETLLRRDKALRTFIA